MLTAWVTILGLFVASTSAGYTYDLAGVSPHTYETAYAPTYHNYKPKDYKFEYGVSDPHTGDHKSQWEVKENGVVRGAYSLLEPDGTTRVVEYIADDDGFRAVVKKLGHNIHEEVSYGDLQPLYKGHSAYGGHYTEYLQNAIYAAPEPVKVPVAVQQSVHDHSLGTIVVPETITVDDFGHYSLPNQHINQYVQDIKPYGHEAIQHDLGYVHQPQVAYKSIAVPQQHAVAYKAVEVAPSVKLAFNSLEGINHGLDIAPEYVEAAQPVYKNVEIAQPAVYKSVEVAQPIYKSVEVAQPIYKSVEVAQPIYKSVEVAQPIYKNIEVAQPAYKNIEIPQHIPAIKHVEYAQPLAYKQVELVQPVEQVAAYKHAVEYAAQPQVAIAQPVEQVAYKQVEYAQPAVYKQVEEYAQPIAYKQHVQPLAYNAQPLVNEHVTAFNHQAAQSYQNSIVHHDKPVAYAVPKQEYHQQVYNVPQQVQYAAPQFAKNIERVEVHGQTGNLVDDSAYTNYGSHGYGALDATYNAAKQQYHSNQFPYAFEH